MLHNLQLSLTSAIYSLILAGCCVVFILISGTIQAQANFQYLNKKDGLSQVSVFSIAQDSTGFIWFGTRDGLNRYDGNRFRVFRKGTDYPGLAGSDIRNIYVDPLTKEIWIGTHSGLSRFNTTLETFDVYQAGAKPNALVDNIVRNVFRDRENNLWVATSEGLHLYQSASNDFQRISISTTEKLDVRLVTQGEKGSLLVGTSKGLYQLDDDNSGAWRLVDGLRNLHITCGEFDDRGNLWLGTLESGLFNWNPETDTVSNFNNNPDDPRSLSNDRVRDLAFDEEGSLWVGTFEGLNLLRPGQVDFTRFKDQQDGEGALIHNSIRSLMVDHRNNLWVGTFYGGIHHLDQRFNFFTNYRQRWYQNSLSANVVSSFAENTNGDLWVGTEGGGLNYFSQETGQFTRYSWAVNQGQRLEVTSIKALLRDSFDLWVGTYRAGLLKYNTQTDKITHYGTQAGDEAALTNENVYGLLKKDNKLWILTYGGGINVLDLATNKIRAFTHRVDDPSSPSSNNTRTITERNSGGMWVGTGQGLNLVSVDSGGYPLSFSSTLTEESVYVLAPAARGVWAGTFNGGLFLCDEQGQIIKNYTTKDGLPDNSIFGIQKDDDGYLWLSTGYGISRFDPDLETFNNFNVANGLENLEFNFNAAFKTSEGHILFGGITGFTTFDPTAYEPSLKFSPVVFTRLFWNSREVEIGNEDQLLAASLNVTEEITFAYNEANFTIEFAALDYFSPGNNTYAYMLQGLDRDWNYGVGTTQASYNVQREGDYTFLLRGGNSDGALNPSMRQISIRVLPPPWRTWWAYLLYAAFIGALVYALIRVLRLRHKIQLQALEQKKQEELTEVKLRFFTNITHEFRTPLTLILGPLDQLVKSVDPHKELGIQLGRINSNAKRLLNLVNQVLTFRKLETDYEPLSISPNSLKDFFSKVFNSFVGAAESANITYQMSLPDEDFQLWFDRSKMEKVFYNLLSNAFKFTPDGGTILLVVEEHEDQFIVRVRDSGVGVPRNAHEDIFKRFYEKSLNKQSTIKSSGIGLAVSKQMIELQGGAISIVDNEQPGAEFIVAILKGRDHFSDVVNNIAESSTEQARPQENVRDKIAPTIETAPATKEQALLIVDDNKEIRSYVTSIFSGYYQVLEATTGEEGLRVARKALPDLIISDVMMPVMDGMAFCHNLKNDIEISHIPVILLTARSGQPFRIEGLRTGADDYLTKPFNPEELRLRVANLLKNRQLFKKSFSASFDLEPNRIEVASVDEEFLRNTLIVAEKNVQDVNFKVEDFARDLAVSRTFLFNKLKALTGQTPNKFMKTFRLKRASQLLLDSDYRIGKIASMVGFRDERYFRECFKVQYGESPRDYRKNNAVEK